MRIPFLERFFASKDDVGRPTVGSPKNINHSTKDILRLLGGYAHEHHLITIQRCNPDGSVDKQSENTTTGIIAIDEKKKTIAFEQFTPSDIELTLKNGDLLHFSLTHEGIYCQFNCQYAKTINTKEGYAHIFKLPQGIEQVQLRDAFRVSINRSTPIKVNLLHTINPVIAGSVVDLSSKGIRMRMKGLIEPKPKRGEEYISCQMVLTDGYSMHCEAKLMHWIYDPKDKCTYLGIQFVGLEGTNERVLNRYITQLQRSEKSIFPR
ncbi:hypothetical protein A9Q99_08535 [Gammaproteobacteria bacterium 45_16_T64]|nr:hypothetical protein A9Q99_08535 [Gammaproteobacteria bacterium 45_16_T64]